MITLTPPVPPILNINLYIVCNELYLYRFTVCIFSQIRSDSCWEVVIYFIPEYDQYIIAVFVFVVFMDFILIDQLFFRWISTVRGAYKICILGEYVLYRNC